MSIHADHPFAAPEPERSPARRFRGRLASPVSLWTAAGPAAPAGLTVSSMLVANGDPGYAVGVIDDLSDLWDALRSSQRVAITLLNWDDRGLADRFGYVAPSPGGPFAGQAWLDTEWGPVPQHATSWAGGSLVPDATRPLGWGLQVTVRLDRIELGEDRGAPLVHRRARYATF